LKILIPTDFSEQAEFAFLLVKNMAAKVETDIHFLHVMDVPDTVTFDDVNGFETCGDIDQKTLEARKQIIDRKLANLKTLYGEHIHTHFVVGKLTDAISRFAETNQFHLIAMGTKGAWGLKERFSGSEAQQVARHASTPVLALKCDRSDLQFKHLLLVHNFAKPQEENISFIRLLQKAFNSTIHLLQIVQNETEKENALAGMDTFAHINMLHEVEKHTLIDKDVENGVIHFNQMQDTDLICIGTHGRSAFAHLMRSSATEKLVNHLFKPIFSFKIN